jgi:hypothetical protein
MRLLQNIALTSSLLFLLAGCSGHYHPLALDKKVKLVAELIDHAPECQVFKDRLADPAIDDDGVDAVYSAATKAHCVQKHV